jgi:DNA polymerase-3 subunit epsilon
VAGDLFDHLAGRRLVAHNVRFAFGFLAYEATRADLAVTWPTPICTLLLASALGLPTRLPDLAAAVRVPHERAHAASDDAAAIADLFVVLGPRGQDGIDAVAAGAAPFTPPTCPPGSGRVWTRNDATLPRTNSTFLARLASSVSHLPATVGNTASEAALAYADLLDRALEDRVLTTSRWESFSHWPTVGVWPRRTLGTFISPT